ncbi:MAG: FG-GAP-like repeat-containing protein [Planctomycetes bacterium]|nr:FG-GAP-like repeat-containing protein [Planctomycetota bacterium]MCH9725943.1 FG-GAP-like repeat-containing protein [Planctomycetota bacterium]MCH9777096.1 FG-GAP-like repeat-containing protein [Planctomycetota bacterium]MCH9792165.1 FG-GAP-like repeat-containing protein [Planctomycetota bacterium]
MLRRNNVLTLLSMLLFAFCFASDQIIAEDRIGSRFTYLDERDPYYPHADFPKLTTPMWVGEDGVDAVILLSVDDMGGPAFRPRYDVSPEAFARFLSPLIQRLKQIDGRAPVAIMTCQSPADSKTSQQFLKDGLSLDCHTFTHRFPFFRSNEGYGPDEALALARLDYLACLENLFEVPGNRPVAHRMPGCDAQNSVSPRFFTEVFPLRTEEGRFLTCDSSITTWFPSDDKTLPRKWRYDSENRPRFDKYVNKIPQTRHFVNSIRNYPYPYAINQLIWELPVTIPGDSHGVHQNKAKSSKTTDDWKRAVDICVQKQGLCNLLFHTIGYCDAQQLVDVIDYADRTYGKPVKFLNCREIYDRLTKNVLGGVALRSKSGGDNGVRLLDVNADGFLDAVISNSKQQTTRIWEPKSKQWREIPLPVQILSNEDTGASKSHGVHFFTASRAGHAGLVVANEGQRDVWRFKGGQWERLKGALPEQVDGKPLRIVERGVDRGVRFRDLDGDGVSDLIVNNDIQNAVYLWSHQTANWQRATFALPERGCLVDERGLDQGLRFVDLDGDKDDDIILSNERGYWVRLFAGLREGWSKEVVRGKPGDQAALPMIVRDGKLNGVWFHSGAMILQNEHTVMNKDYITRIPFSQFHDVRQP